MTDALKIAVKTGLIAVITLAIVAVFTTIQLPTPDFSGVYTAVSKALAIVNYWCPIMGQLFDAAIKLMGVAIALYLMHFGLIATRWIMKVNE